MSEQKSKLKPGGKAKAKQENQDSKPSNLPLHPPANIARQRTTITPNQISNLFQMKYNPSQYMVKGHLAYQMSKAAPKIQGQQITVEDLENEPVELNDSSFINAQDLEEIFEQKSSILDQKPAASGKNEGALQFLTPGRGPREELGEESERLQPSERQASSIVGSQPLHPGEESSLNLNEVSFSIEASGSQGGRGSYIRDRVGVRPSPFSRASAFEADLAGAFSPILQTTKRLAQKRSLSMIKEDHQIGSQAKTQVQEKAFTPLPAGRASKKSIRSRWPSVAQGLIEEQIPATPAMKSGRSNFEVFAQDIHHLPSLLNIWKEEFIRRMDLGLPKLELSVPHDLTRIGGYSESLTRVDFSGFEQIRGELSLARNLKVREQFLLFVQPYTELAEAEPNQYHSLAPLDRQVLITIINSREQPFGEQPPPEDHKSMSYYITRRRENLTYLALGKEVYQELEELRAQDELDDRSEVSSKQIDTFDAMPSLREQFANMKQRSADKRFARASAKTKLQRSIVKSNRKITDFYGGGSRASSLGPQSALSSPRSGLSIHELLPYQQQQQIPQLGQGSESDLDGEHHLEAKQIFPPASGYLDLSQIVEDPKEQMNSQLLSTVKANKMLTQDEGSTLKPLSFLHPEGARYYLKGDKITKIEGRSSPQRPARVLTADFEMHPPAFYTSKQDFYDHINRLVQTEAYDVDIDDLAKKVGVSPELREILEGETHLKMDYLIAHEKTSKSSIKPFGWKQTMVVSKYLEKTEDRAEALRLQEEQKSQKNQDVHRRQSLEDSRQSQHAESREREEGSGLEGGEVEGPVLASELQPEETQPPPKQYPETEAEWARLKMENEFKYLECLDKQFTQEISSGTTMAIEVIVKTRGDSFPSWEKDPVSAVFIVIDNEAARLHLMETLGTYSKVAIMIINRAASGEFVPELEGREVHSTLICNDEFSLIARFIEIIREHDPDVIVGYETEIMSIGFLCKRADKALGFRLTDYIQRESRTFKPFNDAYFRKRFKEQNQDFRSTGGNHRSFSRQRNSSSQNQLSRGGSRGGSRRGSQTNLLGNSQPLEREEIFAPPENIQGRVVINLWRMMRHELHLQNYDIDTVAKKVLGEERVPHIIPNLVSESWQESSPESYQVLDQAFTVMRFLEKLDLIPRDMNMAKVMGIDYESVMSRGSQFRVESLLSRVAKAADHLLLSASSKQVSTQNELEVIPLVIEPDSRLYTDPVVVVDFQSLYPSIIIAYNLCYSTCLGKIDRIEDWNGNRKFGVWKIPASMKQFFGYQPQDVLSAEEEDALLQKVNIAPNLCCYVKKDVKEGLLPRMLREILNTRIMVKKSMKVLGDSHSKIQKMLDSRQLALKLIANVTYGYTAAGFTGRMPCVEIADSVLSLSRHTIETALNLINSREADEGTRVIYGDTDSLFIQCKGASLKRAFDIGESLTAEVTKNNPHPMELKFEKVYHPCITIVKKRYSGMAYFHRDQKEPTFESKGIEVVRRDAPPVLQRIQGRLLQSLFKEKDLSRCKEILFEEWTQILKGRIDFREFILASEVKVDAYKNEQHMPKSAVVSKRRRLQDEDFVQKHKERVPYVVVCGQEGTTKTKKRVKDLCVSPQEYVESDGVLKINYPYYINNVINSAMNRIFEPAFGINIEAWYSKMPKILGYAQQYAGSVPKTFFSKQRPESISAPPQTNNETSNQASQNHSHAEATRPESSEQVAEGEGPLIEENKDEQEKDVAEMKTGGSPPDAGEGTREEASKRKTPKRGRSTPSSLKQTPPRSAHNNSSKKMIQTKLTPVKHSERPDLKMPLDRTAKNIDPKVMRAESMRTRRRVVSNSALRNNKSMGLGHNQSKTLHHYFQSKSKKI